MAESKPTSTDAQRLTKLEQGLADARWQITQMQKVGGFADSKTLSMRSARLEDRVEVLEANGTMHQDVTAHTVELLTRHLGERHGLELDRSQDPDVIFLRKIRRRLREWAEASGLMRKRSDIREARQDENRLRPSAAQS